MLKPFLADLHIHTVLSGCAEVEMIPPLILRQAKRLGLSLIAITDHNCMSQRGSRDPGIRRERTFTCCRAWNCSQKRRSIFCACSIRSVNARSGRKKYSRRLPPLGNKEEIFGAQFVVDSTGEWVRTEERFLAGAADMGLEEVVAEVHSIGGMVIPAHVDRPSFSLLSNLGLVPESLAGSSAGSHASVYPGASDCRNGPN